MRFTQLFTQMMELDDTSLTLEQIIDILSMFSVKLGRSIVREYNELDELSSVERSILVSTIIEVY